MLLSCRMLLDVGSVNTFKYVQRVSFTAADPQTVYFQLLDASLDTSADGFSPPGRRYMPAAGASLSVVLDSIDISKRITRTATQPFASDPSIWSVSVLASDTIKGTVNLKLALTEGTVIRRGALLGAIGVEAA